MSKQSRADLLLLLITAIWGISFTLIKNVLADMPSFAYLAIRFMMATAVLVILFHKRLKHLNKKIFLCGGALGVMLFGGMALLVCGLYTTTASNSAFISGLQVVLIPMVSAVILKKKPDRSSAIGVVAAFAGLFFLWGGLDIIKSGGASVHFTVGDFLTLLSALCFTLQVIFIDRFTQDMDAALLAVVQIGFATVLFSGVWLEVDFRPFTFNGSVLMILLVTSVLGTALAFGGQTLVQRFTTPTHTALIFTCEPVFGALFALIIPNAAGVTETLNPNKVIGCVLILAGMLAAEMKTKRSGETPGSE